MTTPVATDLNLPGIVRTSNNPSPARGDEEQREHNRTTPETTMPSPAPTLAAPVDETPSPPAAVGDNDITTSDDLRSAGTSSVIEGGDANEEHAGGVDIAVGVSLGVSAAVLLIAGMVTFEMRTFLCGRAR